MRLVLYTSIKEYLFILIPTRMLNVTLVYSFLTSQYENKTVSVHSETTSRREKMQTAK